MHEVIEAAIAVGRAEANRELYWSLYRRRSVGGNNMLDMKIGKYHITSNVYEVSAWEMKMDSDGNPRMYQGKGDIPPHVVESLVGHYNNLNQALKGLARYIIRTDSKKITNFSELRQQYLDIQALFEEYLNDRAGDDGKHLDAAIDQIVNEGDAHEE